MKHAREDYNRIQDPANLIPKDEPVFLLRGQDMFASDILRRWATMLANSGGDHKMWKMVIDHADLMEEWQKTNKVKMPDLP